VCTKVGDIWVIQPNGVMEPEPFLHVDVDTAGERGLASVAFHPDFATNGYVYIYYAMATEPVHSRVSRFTASTTNPNVAEPGSEHVILDLDPLESTLGFHISGDMHFDQEKKLFISVGDDADPTNSQNGANLLGKMLRLHHDGTVPPDNPFIDTGARPEIYAYGLRNAFRFDIQPKTGLTYVNEVGSFGEGAREEVNRLWYGGNYGWPIYEGYSNNPDYTDPEYAYEHGTDPETGSFNCAVTGAAFYGPGVRQFPREYVGDYFFTDYCGQWIKRIDRVTGTVSLFASDAPPLAVDVAVDSQGSLFYLSQFGGIYRITYAHPSPIPPVFDVHSIGRNIYRGVRGQDTIGESLTPDLAQTLLSTQRIAHVRETTTRGTDLNPAPKLSQIARVKAGRSEARTELFATPWSNPIA
jgi:glucose/arabinose dehydrogenase